jgi:hypothetical protein
MIDNESFLSAYTQLEKPLSRVSFLQEAYPILQSQRIIAQEVQQVLGPNFLGKTTKGQDEYKITVQGDDEMQGYLTFHEFLHVWLEETGRTISFDQGDIRLSSFLFLIKNLVNDFLIETEINRRCGQFYGNNVGCSKDRQITGNMMGLGNASGLRIFSEGLLAVALSHLYPKMAHLESVQIFTQAIHHPSSKEIVDALLKHHGFSITSEQYQDLIMEICILLTDSQLRITNGKIYFDDPEEVLAVIDGANRVFENIKNLLRGIRGR